MEKLPKISLAISILGILALLIISNTLEPKTTSINKLTEKQINQKVKISGQLIKVYQDKNKESDFQILTIQDKTGEIKAILNSNQNFTKYKNQSLIVIGAIKEYKNELEIQVEKISFS